MVIGVIPARFASTRFPGKPLHKILGKPLLQWVIEAAQRAKLITEVCVATDDLQIADLAESCGVRAIMTDSDLPSGTDRIWQAVKDLDAEIILNIQGDEPLITGEVLDQLVQVLKEDSQLEMATLAHPIRSQEALTSLNTAKIALNHQNEALYFSRFPIPFSREKMGVSQRISLQHIGIYGYKKGFLKQFCQAGVHPLEKAEGLEQLRALFMGARIRVVEVGLETRGVDTPEDVKIVEDALQKMER